MPMSEKGFTVVELLISMAIVGVVLTGIYGLVVTSSKFYLAQNAVVAMHADGRAAMDFMVRELRSAMNPVVSTTTASNDTIAFERVEDTGYSSGGNSATTLNDARKTWQGNMFEPSSSSAYMVRIIAGTGAGQDPLTINQNTTTRLTLSAGWGVIPDDTSFYVIIINKGFTRTSATDNVLRYRIGATGANNPLAENITLHSFQLSPPNTITVTLTARTVGKDPITQQFREYTLSEDVRRRN
jgi:prepilin-type N-terminal cleavage/methylation domain-containing protein